MRHVKLLIILLLFCCGEDSKKPAGYLPPLRDVFELELSFGAENVKDEFLLAIPQDIAVDEAGNMYVTDEDRIKVFDSNGKEKTIIGGPGQGPGEFSSTPKLSINDDGLLTALAGSSFNLFSANNKFIRKIQYKNEPLYNNYKKEKALIRQFQPENVCSLSETERIVTAGAWKELKDGNLVTADVIIYEKADTLIELVHHAPDNIKGLRDVARISLTSGEQKVYAPVHHKFYVTILPNKHIAYTHSFYDAKNDNNEFTYTIHIVNLENLQEYQISLDYKPVNIQKELSSGRYNEQGEKVLKSFLKNMKYFSPLSSLLYDKELIFAVHDMYPASLDILLKEGETSEFLTDIFDSETGKYLKSAYFPFNPDVIKNGYAYRIKLGIDIFPQIEKYKIDPAVYGK